jgi:SAM-dependent methyltransferase
VIASRLAERRLNLIIVARFMVGFILAVLISLVVVLVVVPAILFGILGVGVGKAKDWRERVGLRYQGRYRWKNPIEGPRAIFVWMFALAKMRLDPMFGELPGLIQSRERLETALDIGCGFGVAGCALLEWHSALKIYGVDPNRGRVRVARAVFGERGEAFAASAPDFVRHGIPDRVDLVLVLDVIHFVPDAGLAMTFERIHGMLNEGGLLIVRAIVPPSGGGSLWWNVARARRWITGQKVFHRTPDEIRRAMEAAGFAIRDSKISGGNVEMHWFVASGSGGR